VVQNEGSIAASLLPLYRMGALAQWGGSSEKAAN